MALHGQRRKREKDRVRCHCRCIQPHSDICLPIWDEHRHDRGHNVCADFANGTDQMSNVCDSRVATSRLCSITSMFGFSVFEYLQHVERAVASQLKFMCYMLPGPTFARRRSDYEASHVTANNTQQHAQLQHRSLATEWSRRQTTAERSLLVILSFKILKQDICSKMFFNSTPLPLSSCSAKRCRWCVQTPHRHRRRQRRRKQHDMIIFLIQSRHS